MSGSLGEGNLCCCPGALVLTVLLGVGLLFVLCISDTMSQVKSMLYVVVIHVRVILQVAGFTVMLSCREFRHWRMFNGC